MLDQIVFLAAVTILGVFEQAYFSLQVIAARRKYHVQPPSISGPPEFERIFRAQANCSEYFPLFLASLWVAGLFFNQVLAACCGLLYLYARYLYFAGFAESSKGRLGPMYLNAGILWAMAGLSSVGILNFLLLHYLKVNILRGIGQLFGL
ncbi:leukotriene C4 synthase-like [Protopterus annectens]|uniref:leukotriene C4 synthase-like n=1 Tax=Protopterus annectens TaxID=7888 RepID=UPI001CFB8816|nr:leukotriene C4 synthase-like [Protopterus annectens]